MNREEAQALKVFQTQLKLESGVDFHLRYGPLDLYIVPEATEFRVYWMTSNDWMDSSFHYQYPFDGALPLNLLSEKRFAFGEKCPTLKVAPILGERPFVVKPNTTFKILSDERAKIFLSTPMNMALTDVDNQQKIDEIPVLHRVKTWFGETPTHGQLCFFTKIHAALVEANLPFRPHRALTHLHIENRCKEPLTIEKLKIPVNYLTLYQDSRGLFVTSSLHLTIGSGGRLKRLQIEPPGPLSDLVVVEKPREAIPSTLFQSTAELMR